MEAMSSLGLFYMDGVYFPKNYKISHYWYEKALELGSPTACNNIGLFYMHGHGVDVDLDLA
jgi:TPR repeat protein